MNRSINEWQGFRTHIIYLYAPPFTSAVCTTLVPFSLYVYTCIPIPHVRTTLHLSVCPYCNLISTFLLQGQQGVPGPRGMQGEPGVNGTRGPTGPQGAAGKDGLDGLPGVQGAEGPQGPQGDTGATGQVGPQGLQGLPGNDGEDGKDGRDGVNATWTIIQNGPSKDKQGLAIILM